MHTHTFGTPTGSAPTFCPRCSTRVELTAHGTVAPHNVRLAGPSCDGAGLTPTGMPPWPGTIKPSPTVKRLRIRRLTRSGRRSGSTSLG
jgi:hypothetical protein